MEIKLRAWKKNVTVDVPDFGEENMPVYRNEEFYNRIEKNKDVMYGVVTDEKTFDKIINEYGIAVY